MIWLIKLMNDLRYLVFILLSCFQIVLLPFISPLTQSFMSGLNISRMIVILSETGLIGKLSEHFMYAQLIKWLTLWPNLCSRISSITLCPRWVFIIFLEAHLEGVYWFIVSGLVVWLGSPFIYTLVQLTIYTCNSTF